MKLVLLCLAAAALGAQPTSPAAAHEAAHANAAPATHAQAAEAGLSDSKLTVVVNESLIVEHPAGLRRVSISTGDIAEAVAVNSHEVLLNGKAPGVATLILWDPKGNRANYEVHVVPNGEQLQAVRNELAREVGPAASLDVDGGIVFLRGTVRDEVAANRALMIASTLGKVVNLLRIEVPPSEPQILLKVRFATVSRSASLQFGFNIFSMNQKGVGNSTTGQFGQYPTFNFGQSSSVTFTDLLNIFYFRPDLNLGAIIQDLQARSLAQILAEPNLLTVSGKPASFLAGGEFPFPTIQGGAAGVGQITVQFKEFGIRLNFLPEITPRGTIRLAIRPEVSSLDYSNGLTVNGFTVPGLATRRVETEVELENGQSFVIAGLLDNQTTEQISKMPGLANIPVLGKLFQSRSITKNDDELMVLVTPQIVAPIPAGVTPPHLNMPTPFLKDAPKTPPQNPGPEITGPVQPLVRMDSIPFERLSKPPTPEPPAAGGAANPNPVPLPVLPPLTPPGAGAPTPSASGQSGSGSGH